MKKLTLLLIFIIYGVASFGLSLNYFYCCGKLKDVRVVLTTPQDNPCPHKKTRDCGENITVSYKINLDQKNNFNQVSLKPVQLLLASAIHPDFADAQVVVEQDLVSSYFSEDSPLPPDDLNILLSNFRI